MTTGFYDVDSMVAEAIAESDFAYARRMVEAHAELLSQSDKELLLANIRSAQDELAVKD